ncbi:PDF receptor isoform X2 [Cimex lectularius]|nr:PDF receptor isoform X2 [Cimex lectularius]
MDDMDQKCKSYRVPPSMSLTQGAEAADGESCRTSFGNFSADEYCPAVWDKVLCWPPTRRGSVSSLSCPYHLGLDTTRYVTKKCLETGRWEGKGLAGWTNYTPCYSTEMLHLYRKLFSGSSPKDAAEMKIEIAERTRSLEFVGFSVSLAALIVSLVIFSYFRVLKNNRTKIHKNLFVAMITQVVIRLTLYIDQAVIRSKNSRSHGIDNTPILCEAAYVLLEYARTAMFMWMFIEGLYLHNVVTVRVFQEKFHYRLYTGIGWGVPVAMTATWAAISASQMKTKCWWGYNFTIYFWILEGPRVAVILLNFLFLLNIIRVLVVKLRQSRTSEVEQARKAVRAAVVLLPLLGITNLVNMMEAPLDRQVWEFAAWSYTTHFLTSFQGLFVAVLYCFLNGEVRAAVKKSVYIYFLLRPGQFTPRRNSAFVSAACPQPPELPPE